MEKSLREFFGKKTEKVERRIKGAEDFKAASDVFDKSTLISLYELANKGYIEEFFGVIGVGKEANIFAARGKKELYAVKIYRITTSDFKAMKKYIEGDYRFKFVKDTKKSLINAWVEKEFKNLKIAEAAGVRVPHPFVYKNNILVMELIHDQGAPAPMLKEVGLGEKEAGRIYATLVSYAKKLYKADLVHGDLSEYNVLLNKGEAIVIDISQGVPLNHALADELLERDLRNIARFFRKDYEEVIKEFNRA